MIDKPNKHEDDFPVVAIVGPMNAGKSTLFNKLAGERLAVTSDVPGTTRDRQYSLVSWNKRRFYLLDTAGLSFKGKDDDMLEKNVLKQIQTAKEEADVLLFVIDGKYGTDSVDRQVLLEFRKSKKPLILVINKLDAFKMHEEAEGKFAKLGIKTIVPVSSITSRGTGELMDEIVKVLPKTTTKIERLKKEPSIHIAIVGKPNVGKSSLFNKILNAERMVVSSVPGTTRTAIDSELEINGTKFTFIDTAGLKRKAKKQIDPDVFSTYQVFKSIRRSDICFLVVDLTDKVTHQDLAIAQNILEQSKGCIILANKLDRLPKLSKLKGRQVKNSEFDVRENVSAAFPFLQTYPLFLVSANTGSGIMEAIEMAKKIFEVRHITIHQDELNRLLARRMKINPPKRLKDQKIPKVFGLNQIGTNPPTFELLVNTPSAISEQFRKSVQNAITSDFDFSGTPVKLLIKKKI